MKKRAFGILAALFALTLALVADAYATDAETAELNAADVYAILYEDGEMVFQNSATPDGRVVKATYEVDLTAVYTGFGYPSSNYAPWYDEGEFIRVVSFADKVSPTSTAYWFCGCHALERLDNLQNLDTASVVDMSHMFSNCSGLTALDVSHFNTAIVINMSAMFSFCSGLTALDVSHFNTANVTDMRYMFSNCSGLTTLDLSCFDTTDVTHTHTMFSGCSNLKIIYASDKFTTVSVKSSFDMFKNCAALVGGNGTTYDKSHTDVEYARIDTASEPGYFTAPPPPVSAPAPTPADGVHAMLYYDGTFVFQNGNAPESDKIFIKAYPVDVNAVYTYDHVAPRYDEQESIRVVNFADKISPTVTAYWFYECKNLERVDNIQNLDISSVASMAHMFSYCSELTELDVSGFDTANVKSMFAMFNGCSGLTTLDVSRFDTANVTNMSLMFNDCSGLTTLDVSRFDTANVTSMYDMFSGCRNLKTIYASDKFITASVTEYWNMFSDCKVLIGGDGSKYDKSHTGKEYARIGRPSVPGYFTYKPYAPDEYAIADAVTGNELLSVIFSNPNATTLAVSYFDYDEKFISAGLQSVDANAGTVALELAAGAKTARVMLLDSDFRPLCAAYSVGL